MPGPGALRSLDEQGRALVERLGGRWTPRGGVCRCPAHNDERPSLSVRVGRTSLLLHCFAGCDAEEVLRALRTAGQPLEVPPEGTSTSDWCRTQEAAHEASRRAAIRIWGSACSAEASPAERYLRGRGLDVASAELRFHPRTPDGPHPHTQYRPALIAAVRDQTGLVGVHRTFLETHQDRLAPIGQPRRGLGRFGRGAVRLGGIAARLGLAEGIETALSATILFGVPCWATLGTERFGLVGLPPEVTELVLFLDHDQGGQRAEAIARAAYAHLPIETHRPARDGDDWNDVLRARLRLGRSR
jgi:hypothetical protein